MKADTDATWDRSRWRPSPAMVISVIALFVALSGTALALGTGTVKSRHIAKGAVKSKQVKNGAIRTAKLAPGAVTAPKVAPDALGGDQIDEASLELGSAGCRTGLIHSFAMIEGGEAIPSTFTSRDAFLALPHNCSGGAVEVRRQGPGHYFIRFPGDPSALALSSATTGGRIAGTISRADDGSFSVALRSATTGELADGVVTVLTF